MRTSIRVAGTTAFALALTALAAAPASASSAGGAAVFALSDNLTANTVAAFDRGPGGELRPAGVYGTGGRGGQLAGSVVDHTASQGALALDRGAGLLYAVNAGSDTLTVFDVRGDRLARAQVVGSSGSFPVSVTVHGDLVYVLNARDGGTDANDWAEMLLRMYTLWAQKNGYSIELLERQDNEQAGISHAATRRHGPSPRCRAWSTRCAPQSCMIEPA